MRKALVLVALALAGCGEIKETSTLARPAAAGRPYVAGVGDTVMDLRLSQSLPNAMGRADAFGRTRDSGRILVRYLGLQGNQAVFSRQDVAIQSNETTMNRTPMPLPVVSTTSGSGSIGNIPVSGSSTTYGTTWIPPQQASIFPIPAGQVQLVVPVGGSALIEGRRLTVLKPVEGGIEYAVQ